MYKLKDKCSRLIEALSYELLVAVILIIVTLQGYIEGTLVALIIGCFTIWPIYELIYLLCINRVADNKALRKLDVKISICMWVVITAFLWMWNIITDKSTLWALYPTIGIACWPIIVSIKYFYFKRKF